MEEVEIISYNPAYLNKKCPFQQKKEILPEVYKIQDRYVGSPTCIKCHNNFKTEYNQIHCTYAWENKAERVTEYAN